MKKQQIILLIIISSLISAIVSPSVGAVMEEGFSYFPSSSLPQQTVGSGMGEWDNIDTFEVHPGSGRWQDTSNVGYTVTCEDSLLNMSDTGDGSADYYRLERELNSLDDSIEFLFKSIVNSTDGTNSGDQVTIRLQGTGLTSTAFIMKWYKVGSVDNAVLLQYYDIEGITHTIGVSGTEEFQNDTWYRVRIDYDILRSSLRIRAYLDTGSSRLFDYDWQDISDEYIPALFAQTDLEFSFTAGTYTSGVYHECLLNYVKASFAERDWILGDTADSPNWLHYSPYHATAIDDIDDEINYSLCIPYMDAVSGLISLEFEKNTTSDFDHLDNARFSIYICGVDADDGDLHQLGHIRCWIQFVGGAPTFLRSGMNLYHGTTLNRTVYADDNTNPLAWPKYAFEVTTRDERGYVDIIANYWPDREDPDTYFMGLLTIDVSDYVSVVSQEFTLIADWDADFTGDNTLLMALNDFDFLRRESMRGVSPNADGWVATGGGEHPASGGATDPLSILFQTLASAINTYLGPIIEGIGTTISSAIGLIQGWLEAASTAITGAISNIEGWLNTVGSAISTAIGEIAADIWAAFSDAASIFIDDVITATTSLAGDVAGLIDTLIQAVLPYLTALAEDFAGLLIDVLEFVLPLLLALAEYIWGVIAAVVFWVWDELGLPDLLAIVEVLLTGFIQFVNGLPNFLTLLGTAIVVLAYLIPSIGLVLFFGLPLAQGSIGGYIDAMLRYMGFDITFGIGIFGNHVYVPAVAVWLVISLGTVLSGTTYAGFF